jgi:hypothetical protein
MVDQTSSGEPIEFWFNVKTGLVEFGKHSAAPYRIGPFRSEAEAAGALKLLAERSKKWQEDDEAD